MCVCVMSFLRAWGSGFLIPTYLNLVWVLASAGECFRLVHTHPSWQQSDSHCCMSGQEGGSEGIPSTEIKDEIKPDRQEKNMD